MPYFPTQFKPTTISSSLKYSSAPDKRLGLNNIKLCPRIFLGLATLGISEVVNGLYRYIAKMTPKYKASVKNHKTRVKNLKKINAALNPYRDNPFPGAIDKVLEILEKKYGSTLGNPNSSLKDGLGLLQIRVSKETNPLTYENFVKELVFTTSFALLTKELSRYIQKEFDSRGLPIGTDVANLMTHSDTISVNSLLFSSKDTLQADLKELAEQLADEAETLLNAGIALKQEKERLTNAIITTSDVSESNVARTKIYNKTTSIMEKVVDTIIEETSADNGGYPTVTSVKNYKKQLQDDVNNAIRRLMTKDPQLTQDQNGNQLSQIIK